MNFSDIFSNYLYTCTVESQLAMKVHKITSLEDKMQFYVRFQVLYNQWVIYLNI